MLSQVVKKLNARYGSSKVYIFPYAGGNSLSFRELGLQLQQQFEVYLIEPPGHLFDDTPPLRSISSMTRLYMDYMQPGPEGVVLFGHSLGGLVSYCVAH